MSGPVEPSVHPTMNKAEQNARNCKKARRACFLVGTGTSCRIRGSSSLGVDSWRASTSEMVLFMFKLQPSGKVGNEGMFFIESFYERLVVFERPGYGQRRAGSVLAAAEVVEESQTFRQPHENKNKNSNNSNNTARTNNWKGGFSRSPSNNLMGWLTITTYRNPAATDHNCFCPSPHSTVRAPTMLPKHNPNDNGHHCLITNEQSWPLKMNV